jgi:small subunit ribosomal protein S17
MTKKTEQKNTEETKPNGKVLTGVVTSTKMTDTITVSVSTYAKHPKYGKFLNTQKKYKAHDAGNTAAEGDMVKIVETKPISKDKRFTLLEIVK